MSLFPRYRSIQFKMLFWITISFVIPFFVAAFLWDNYLLRNSLSVQSVISTQQLNSSASHIIKEVIDPPTKLLALIESDPLLQTLPAGSVRNYLNEAELTLQRSSESETNLSNFFDRIKNNFTNVNFIFLGLSDGSYMESPDFNPQKTYDPRLRPWYQNTINSNEIKISEAYYTSETNEKVISFTKSIRLPNGLKGVLGITMNIDQLAHSLSNYNLNNDGKIILLTSTNQVLVSPLDEDWTLKNLPTLGRTDLLTQTSNRLEPFSYHGDYYKVLHQDSKTGLKFIAVYPKSSILSLKNEMIQSAITIIIFLWLIIVLITLIIMRKFTKPLLELVKLIRAADLPNFEYSGELDSAMKQNDEIGLISQSVLDLILTLRQIVDYSNYSQSATSSITNPHGYSAINKLSQAAIQNKTVDQYEKESVRNQYLMSRKELLASEDRLQKAFDLLKDGLWEYRPASSELYFNRNLKQIGSIEEQKNIQLHDLLLNLISPPFLAGYEQAIQDIVSKKMTYFETELCIRGVDGTDKWHLARISSFEEADQTQSLIGTFSDIHESKTASETLLNINATLEEKINDRTQDLLAMNEELIAMNEEVIETNNALKETQEHLIRTEKLSAIGILVSGVAHEINTPLGNSITASSYLQKLYTELEDAFTQNRLTKSVLSNFLHEVREAINLLESNLTRSAELILTFRSISGDNSNEAPRIFYLEENVNEVLTAVKSKFKDVPFKVDLDISPLLFLKAYPGEFSQILTNLFINSLVHGFDGVTPIVITIKAERKDQTILFHYQDDGVGMATEVLQNAFNPFYTTNRSKGCTGLGLFFVHTIITTHFNGTLECKSTPGNGTAYEIIFSDLM